MKFLTFLYVWYFHKTLSKVSSRVLCCWTKPSRVGMVIQTWWSGKASEEVTCELDLDKWTERPESRYCEDKASERQWVHILCLNPCVPKYFPVILTAEWEPRWAQHSFHLQWSMNKFPPSSSFLKLLEKTWCQCDSFSFVNNSFLWPESLKDFSLHSRNSEMLPGYA